MTNPDNVGGLPELPEPMRMGLNDSIPFDGYYTVDQMRAYGEQWRIYGLACGRMSEAATLDWLGNHLVGHINIRTGAGKSYITAENGEELRYSIDEAMREDLTAYGELCRAAPAGGDTSCDMGDLCIGCTPRNADGSCPDAAPAGSGEVGSSYMTEVAKQNGFPIYEIDFGDEGKERYIRERDMAALLRKLQHGAEPVGTRQQTLRRLAGELEACDPDFTRGIAQCLRGRAYILDAVMTGSASQGQEGGNG